MAAGVRLKASSNIDECFAQIDGWVSDVANVAMPRAVNKLMDQAEVAGERKIAQVYRISSRDVRNYVAIKYARNGEPEAVLTVKGAAFPLSLFKPRQIKGRLTRRKGGFRQGGGVQVQVKGRTILIDHAFLATMKSGHRGVFARGAYGGKGKIVATGQRFGRFQFGKKRFSINELFTFGAPEAFRNPEVVDAMNDRVEEQAPKVIAQEVRFATR